MEWEREQSTCPHHGGPIADCGDSERTWFPQRRVCYASMMRAYAESLYDKLHESKPFHNGTFEKWGEKRTSKTPFHYRDGVSLWIADTDLTPHDHFLGGAKDCPDCSGGASSQPDASA